VNIARKNIARKVELARRTVLTGFVGLLLLLLATRPLAALPLLLFARGVWCRDWRTHIWLCFVLLFYFLVVINQLAQSPAAWLGWVECALVVALFTSAMLYCRWVKVETTEQGTP
jgi:uncharacterized membrane protein